MGSLLGPAPAVNMDGGRYESDALAYAEVAEAVLAECLAQTDASPPLGLCCQRSSFLICGARPGKPVTPLISWQDGRGAPGCEALRGEEAEIRLLAGLPDDTLYLAPKLHMLLQEKPSWREHLVTGEWLWGRGHLPDWRWSGRIPDRRIDGGAATLLMDVHRHSGRRACANCSGVPREACRRYGLRSAGRCR